MTDFQNDDNDAIDARLRALFAADTAAHRPPPNLAARARAIAAERAMRRAGVRTLAINVVTALLVAAVCVWGFFLFDSSASADAATGDGVFGSSWTIYEVAAAALLIAVGGAVQAALRPSEEAGPWVAG
jgi:ABC-type transporter Mla maintaining outer membrane lipid asymmetry permease subunit MlaE